MSQALGIQPAPTNPGLVLTQWVNDLLPTPGAAGVPDQVNAPAAMQTYLNGVRRVVLEQPHQAPLIRLWDGSLVTNAQLTGEISCSFEDIVDETGKCTVSVPYNNWLQDWITTQTNICQDLNLTIDPIPSQPDWRRRWGGKVVEVHIKFDDAGKHTIDLVCWHFREHAKHLLVGANPILPPEIQLPKLWIMLGPVRTILAVTSLINLGRLFAPGWSTADNILNPFGWINPLNPDAALNVLPTEWPIQVAFVDTALDQSRWSAIGAAWTQTWHDAYDDVLRTAGCVMKVYTYLTTDPDSPNTELNAILQAAPQLITEATGQDLTTLEASFSKLTAPLRNCCVFSFEDKSGVTGPTGTVADGLLDTVAVTLDDLITPIAIDLATGTTFDPGGVLNGESMVDATGIGQTYLIEQLLGVAPGPPQVIWWSGGGETGAGLASQTWTGMMQQDLTFHKGSDKTIMIGSHSPDLVNEAQTFAIRYALSQLSDLIYGAAPSGFAVTALTGNVPGSMGLDNLYQGELDDVLLAWERFTDPIRALESGDVAWQEHYEKGSSGTAYTLASIIDLVNGDWKTRAFAAFKATPMDGYPWLANYDYFLGDRVGFESNGVIYVDNVYSIKYTYDWEKGNGEPVITIGEDKLKADPFGAAFKTMATLYKFVGSVLGQGTLFTT